MKVIHRLAVGFLTLCLVGTLQANTKNPIVKFETNMGDIIILLYNDKAPISVKNFLTYVQNRFYDGTIFHRVIPGFVVQGGGFQPGLVGKKTLPPIVNEAANGVVNKRGTLSMARTQVIDSATSQFFINLSNNTFLDHKSINSNEFGYAVFGEVIEGMDVVDRMGKVQTRTVEYYADVPVQDILIKKASVLRPIKEDKPEVKQATANVQATANMQIKVATSNSILKAPTSNGKTQ